MTKDDAILLAVANARGLVTLTAIEAAEVNSALAESANDLRHALAAAKVAEVQRCIAAVDPACPYGLSSQADRLKAMLEHHREVGEMSARDRSAERAGLRSLSSPTINPVVAEYFGVKPADAS